LIEERRQIVIFCFSAARRRTSRKLGRVGIGSAAKPVRRAAEKQKIKSGFDLQTGHPYRDLG